MHDQWSGFERLLDILYLHGPSVDVEDIWEILETVTTLTFGVVDGKYQEGGPDWVHMAFVSYAPYIPNVKHITLMDDALVIHSGRELLTPYFTRQGHV